MAQLAESPPHWYLIGQVLIWNHFEFIYETVSFHQGFYWAATVWSSNPMDNGSQLRQKTGKQNRSKEKMAGEGVEVAKNGVGDMAGEGVEVAKNGVGALQIVLPFIAPEEASNLLATTCWAIV
ncbi:hypothetical protein ACLKA7_015094 [Drosophila subpalustris]